jgi:hypothetical protein
VTNIEPTVVVIRTSRGEDILTILNGYFEGVLKMEHPHFVEIDPITGNVAIMPYCPLSGGILYELNDDHVEFVVPASTDISSKFLQMLVASYNKHSAEEFTNISSSGIIFESNNTKH